ncbi:MAG: DUF433 domain-containing protein [Proteobacteria bacterium]|nr:DUF433 domain-containing protein [Pseudomonadota bacterium]
MVTLDHITQQPDMMGGKACILGMRVTVGMIVGQIGAGYTIEEILADYPYKAACRFYSPIILMRTRFFRLPSNSP